MKFSVPLSYHFACATFSSFPHYALDNTFLSCQAAMHILPQSESSADLSSLLDSCWTCHSTRLLAVCHRILILLAKLEEKGVPLLHVTSPSQRMAR